MYAANIFTGGCIPLKTGAVDWNAGYFFIAVDFKRDAALSLGRYPERRENSFSKIKVFVLRPVGNAPMSAALGYEHFFFTDLRDTAFSDHAAGSSGANWQKCIQGCRCPLRGLFYFVNEPVFIKADRLGANSSASFEALR